MAENSKLRILHVLNIMKKTDESHPINSTQIVAKLKLNGIKSERKSIGRDLECLQDAGYEIVKCDNHNMGWYMTGQEFEDYELKLLADAVASARFLSVDDSRSLIKKVRELATREGERLINATLIMDENVKSPDKKFKIKFDIIMRAIAERKQLRFQYLEYAEGKNKVLKRNGHVYQVSPYFMALANEEYFLIANPVTHNHVTHFRIEMITGLDVFDEPARPRSEVEELKNIGHDKSINDYLRESVNMWEGEVRDVTLRASNGCKHDVMLRFGRDIFIRDDGGEYFIAHVRVADAIGFYFWLAAHGPYVEVQSPKNIRDGFKDFLLETLENYEG